MGKKFNMTKEELLNEVRETAEGYFDRGELFCSEAVVKTINDLLGKPYNDDVVKLASGFPIGLGKSQCLCGAVSGGEIALGMAYGRNHGESMPAEMFDVAKELHDYTKENYRSTCCRVITKKWQGDHFKSPERKEHCVKITGDIARWTAGKFIEDGVIEVND